MVGETVDVEAVGNGVPVFPHIGQIVIILAGNDAMIDGLIEDVNPTW